MKNKKWIMPVCFACGIAVICLAVAVGAMLSANGDGDYRGMVNLAEKGTDDQSYSFSLTWNTYGISSYDSRTGTLVKTCDATEPEDYKTNLKLTERQYSEIWKLIRELDIESYPDEYDPNEDIESTPSMTLILTLCVGDRVKTVRAKDIALTYESNNVKGQRFLNVCKGIEEILTETEEWKSLPEYEFLYD